MSKRPYMTLDGGLTRVPIAKLPDQPSDLILVALADLEKVEQMRDTYQVNMQSWHARSGRHDKCVVCFAGAVMAQSLGGEPTVSLLPSNFDDKTAAKLEALNDFRIGWIEQGLDALVSEGLIDDEAYKRAHFDDRDYMQYNDGKQFKAQMRKLAADLKEVGL